MANFTANYRLHQWEPTDPFLREDFNQDLSTIDAALGRAEHSAEANAYNVYNLMLQNYYEGKYTGYKKALLFDGFTDDSNIASLEGGFVHLPAEKLIMLDAAGQGSAEVNHSRAYIVYIDNQHTLEVEWTSQGRGTLTGVSLDLVDVSNSPQCLIRVWLNEQQVSERTTTIPDSAAGGWYTMSLEREITLKKGDVVRVMAFRSNEFAGLEIYTANTKQLACRLEITSLGAPNGKLTGVAQEISTSVSRALAWVRHSGGTVGLSLNGAAMTVGEARSMQDLEGHACTEQAFALEGPITSPVTPVLTMENGSEAWLYDYGIVLL